MLGFRYLGRLRRRYQMWRYRRGNPRPLPRRRRAKAAGDAPRATSDRHASSRRRRRAFGIAAVVAFGIVTGLAVVTMSSAVADLEEGRSALLKARRHLAAGAFDDAAADFRAARPRFVDARSTMSNPFVSILAWIPLIGRTPDGIRAMTDAAVLAAEAGDALASSVDRLRGGLETVSLAGNRIPVRNLAALHPAVERAGALLGGALGLADGVATTFVPGRVVDAGDELRSTLRGTISTLDATDAILGALPEIAGMDRPRRYFLAPQDPTELRGTGGAFNYWAILSIDRGRISLQPFHDLNELPSARDAPWPSPALQEAYGSLEAPSAWSYANAPADGPTAAARIFSLWEAGHQDPIDGVIFVDPSALASMLEATGSIGVPGVDVTLTGDNAVTFLTHSAYLMPGGMDARLEYVRASALGIFREFLAEARGFAAISALVEAAANQHLLVNARDPALQAELEAAGITGSVAPAAGTDLFSLTVNNLAGNRIDYYVHRTIDYDVELLADGRAQATASVTFENLSPERAPTGALQRLLVPRWGPDDLAPGEVLEEVSVACGSGCRMIGASLDGRPLRISTQEDTERITTFSSVVRTPPEATSELVFTLELGRVWEGDGAQGAYALSMPTQPTIPGIATTLRVRTPEGMSISAADPGVDTGGSVMSWVGTEVGREIWIRFERGMLGRVWWALQNALLRS